MMMTTTRMHYARASAAAIAAVLALSSTPAIAQEAQPAPTDATPTTVTEPAAATTTATDPAATGTETTASETTATAAPATKARAAARTATRAATKAHQAAKVATRAAAKPAPTASVAPAAAAVPVAAAPVTKPAPVVDMSAQPAPAPVAAKAAPINNDTALELGGGALAILALGAGAFAISRRRRHADDEVWEDDVAMAEEPMRDTVHHEPVAAYDPPVLAPEEPAFAWGTMSPREQHVERSIEERQPGETWVERAYRGPTADNPSQSLRKRLKRAAFFDKREREIAANKAAPVEADAGLPERAMEERQLEAA